MRREFSRRGLKPDLELWSGVKISQGIVQSDQRARIPFTLTTRGVVVVPSGQTFYVWQKAFYLFFYFFPFPFLQNKETQGLSMSHDTPTSAILCQTLC